MLLDTHALLWFLTDDDQLPRSLKEQIIRQSLVYISAVVIWEIAIKGALGKLVLGGKPIDSKAAIEQIIAECSAQHFQFLDISSEHAAQAPFLQSDHRDPFDRLLAAQAVEEGLMLISCDPVFDQLRPGIRFWTEGQATGKAAKKPPRRASDKNPINSLS